MLPARARRPLHLDTEGLAKLIQAAANAGAKTCLVGIGGSATNDGGFGLACGLGWVFRNRKGQAISRWTQLTDLHSLEPPMQLVSRDMRIVVASDVQNPLLGPRGATRVYGPQKGLHSTQFQRAEANLRRLSTITKRTLDRDYAREPGAGAAGGLGFGLMAFAQATVQGGLDLYADHLGLAQHLSWADLVITGEGAVDASTLMGKGVGQIASRAYRLRIPCLALAGHAADLKKLGRRFRLVRALAPGFVSLNQALTHPAQHLARLSAEVAASFFVQPGRRLQ
jgi:glycerate kinase